MSFVEYQQAIFVAVALFVGMILVLTLGRRVGVRQRERMMEGGAAGIGAVEAAIFALLGLMIAFTFQGAASRLDMRRMLIVEEANNIGTAWLRIDVLPAAAQPGMRDLFRQYLDSRLETYRKIPDMAAVKKELDHSAQLQGEIWKVAVASLNSGAPIAVNLMPALNQMFDIVTTRTMSAQMHPPLVLFVMLAFLAFAAAFLAGHGMSGSKVYSWVHAIGFAATLAITVFVIVDMEYPRIGLIRVDSMDQVLIDLRLGMNKS